MPRLTMEDLPKEPPKPQRLPRYLLAEGQGGNPYDLDYYLNGCDPDALGLTESEFFGGDIGDKG